MISVRLTVESSYGFETGIVNIAEGSSALDALKVNHNVTGQEYAGMGTFITSIDDVAQDENNFWLFFVNNESSEKAADMVIPEDGDEITFRYISSEEPRKYF